MTTDFGPREWVGDADAGQICVWRPCQPEQPARLHFAHATGFHAHAYAPLFAELSDIPLAAWDMRGHGHSSAAGDLRRFKSWRIYARDLRRWLEQQPAPVWLAGHSVGAAVSAMVAARHPERVRGLILIEPVFMSRKLGWMLRAGRLSRRLSHNPLAVGALRRRNGFASLDKARQAYRGRGAFKTWPDAWLNAYVDDAFARGEDGLWHLRCDPRWESRSFELTLSNPWEYVRQLTVPTTVLLGQPAQSTVNADARRTLTALCPQAVVREWPEASHFLPMEHTTEVATAIRATLETS